MTSFRLAARGDRDTNGVLYLVVCAVPGAERTLDRIAAEQAAGWEVCVVATERALAWFDAGEVESLTGHPIQSRMRIYGEPLFEPLGDEVLVAPASFNTINKIALGFADDMPSGLICEAIGREVPITVEPQLGEAFAAHPAFADHVARLESAGVQFVWRDPNVRPDRATGRSDR
ncbi:MAG: flavoprotein [Actinomycetota bacterium]|nr:flavoprotein [Actinomycetota bacterium]